MPIYLEIYEFVLFLSGGEPTPIKKKIYIFSSLIKQKPEDVETLANFFSY